MLGSTLPRLNPSDPQISAAEFNYAMTLLKKLMNLRGGDGINITETPTGFTISLAQAKKRELDFGPKLVKITEIPNQSDWFVKGKFWYSPLQDNQDTQDPFDIFIFKSKRDNDTADTGLLFPEIRVGGIYPAIKMPHPFQSYPGYENSIVYVWCLMGIFGPTCYIE